MLVRLSHGCGDDAASREAVLPILNDRLWHLTTQNDVRSHASFRERSRRGKFMSTRPKMPSKAKVLDAAALTAQREQKRQARIDAVITEFGGETDAPAALTRMAEELLYWRRRIRLIAEVVAKVQAEEPFAIIGACRCSCRPSMKRSSISRPPRRWA